MNIILKTLENGNNICIAESKTFSGLDYDEYSLALVEVKPNPENEEINRDDIVYTILNTTVIKRHSSNSSPAYLKTLSNYIIRSNSIH